MFDISWGSFLIGSIIGGIVGAFIGLVFGTMASEITKRREPKSPVVEAFRNYSNN